MQYRSGYSKLINIASPNDYIKVIKVFQRLLHRCVIPENIQSMQQRLDHLITWILEHPAAENEEEEREERERLALQRTEETARAQRVQQESSQTSAANEFLSLLGEVKINKRRGRVGRGGERRAQLSYLLILAGFF